jgi:hypothetical protein
MQMTYFSNRSLVAFIAIGMATAGEANQIFRLLNMTGSGIDGEIEFKDNDGKPSGKRIYIHLDLDRSNERHFDGWRSQPVEVYHVICQKDEATGVPVIRWMNATRQIVPDGQKLDMEAVWRVRDEFFRS